MNILYPSMLHLKLCFATIRSTCVQRKSQPTLPWRTGGPVCKGKRINHVTAASEEPDNRISVRRAASQDTPLHGGSPRTFPAHKMPPILLASITIQHNSTTMRPSQHFVCPLSRRDVERHRRRKGVKSCDDSATLRRNRKFPDHSIAPSDINILRL